MEHSDRPYPDPDRYWKVVVRACAAFSPNRNVEAKIDQLRAYVQDQPTRQQLLFYHGNPLKVASLLAGFELTESVVTRFCEVVAPQTNWH